jgi:hypothetical protein
MVLLIVLHECTVDSAARSFCSVFLTYTFKMSQGRSFVDMLLGS